MRGLWTGVNCFFFLVECCYIATYHLPLTNPYEAVYDQSPPVRPPYISNIWVDLLMEIVDRSL